MSQIIHRYGNSVIIEQKHGQDSAILKKEQFKILDLLNKTGSIKGVADYLTDGFEVDKPIVSDRITAFLKICNEKDFLLSKNYHVTGEENYYYPKTLTIEITNRCNLFCRHCYKNASGNNDIFLNEEILNEILDKYVNKIPAIHFTGGEPLLYKNIEETILQRSSQYTINITTNGTLISSLCDEAIKQVDNFQISFYGYDTKSYESFTGNSMAFDKVIRGFEKMSCLNCSFSVGMMMTDDFLNNAEKYLGILKQYNVSRIVFSEITKAGRGKDYSDSVNKEKLINIVIPFVESAFPNRSNIGSFIDKGLTEDDNSLCTAGETQIGISEDGKLVYCHALDHDIFSLGDYSELDNIIKKGRDEKDFKDRIHRYCSSTNCKDHICPLICSHYEKVFS